MSDTGNSLAKSATGAAVEVTKDAASAAPKAAEAVKKALPEQNPALKMMGLPRFKLPSRNWMIFWTITGSIASAIAYDKWQTRRAREKWCKLVEHIKDEPLATTSLPRTVTIYLSAPPGDGLRSAREHFHNYVKPILVAAAVDWDVVEGRKEGDVRYKTAERVRRKRRMAGEGTPMPPEDHTVESVRENMGVKPFDGVAGDLVIGRHTWKEYIRGLHEGWLGPVDTPAHVDEAMGTVPVVEVPPAAVTPSASISDTATPAAANAGPVESLAALTDAVVTGDAPKAEEPNVEEEKEEEEKKKEDEKPKPRQPPAYISPDAYQTALASRLLPEAFQPTMPVSCPHILGFRNTPIRLYRYFNRRRLADDIGRQVAAAVLASSRSYNTASTVDHDSPSGSEQQQLEQSTVLAREERDWWKTVREPRKEHEESVLIEPITFDDRIASRMRIFELTATDDERAKAIGTGEVSK